MANINNYIDTNNIKVFPSAFRESPASGKFTSEKNFINIINSIVDYPYSTSGDKSRNGGYIVWTDGTTWEIIIHGYYFEFRLEKSNYSNQNVWANIRVEPGDATAALGALVDVEDGNITLDSGGKFKGLFISTESAIKGDNIYSVQIIEKGDVCNKSYAKLNLRSILYNPNQKAQSSKNLVEKLDEIDSADKNILDIVNALNGTSTETEPSKFAVKQNKLSAGDYISIDNATSKISVNTKTKNFLDSATANKGNATKFVYIKDGVVTEPAGSDSTVGKKTDPTTGKNGAMQFMYLNNGTFTSGNTIFISSADPSGGVAGDIWFKYQ